MKRYRIIKRIYTNHIEYWVQKQFMFLWFIPIGLWVNTTIAYFKEYSSAAKHKQDLENGPEEYRIF